jgi:single-strand DNA-binding protein
MSADQNNINLTGRIVRDAEVRQTKSGKAVCNVALAVSGYRREDETTFFDLTLFDGKTGVAQFLKKGTRVAVNGRLKPRKFTRKDGTEGFGLEVAVNDLTLLGGKQESSDGPLIEHKRGARPGDSWSSDAANDTDDIPF